MTTEILPTIAAEINRHHQAAQSLAYQTRATANEALSHAVQAGRYIEQAQGITKGQTLAWLRDNVPDLTPQRAKAYLSLFHTAEARNESIVDHRQLILLGVIDQRQVDPQPAATRTNPDKWVRWVGGVAGHIRGMIQSRPLTDWEREEREAVADQLKPIVELYRALGGQVP